MTYKLSDSVSMRLIQIFQEAVILGVDGADLLRQVRLSPSELEEGTLVLEPTYAQQVEDGHRRLVDDATARAASKNIFEGGPVQTPVQ